MLRRAWGAERLRAAGKAAGSLAGSRWGSGPGRTWNMPSMFLTCATSQSRGWLKSRAS